MGSLVCYNRPNLNFFLSLTQTPSPKPLIVLTSPHKKKVLTMLVKSYDLSTQRGNNTGTHTHKHVQAQEHAHTFYRWFYYTYCSPMSQTAMKISCWCFLSQLHWGEVSLLVFLLCQLKLQCHATVYLCVCEAFVNTPTHTCKHMKTCLLKTFWCSNILCICCCINKNRVSRRLRLKVHHSCSYFSSFSISQTHTHTGIAVKSVTTDNLS